MGRMKTTKDIPRLGGEIVGSINCFVAACCCFNLVH